MTVSATRPPTAAGTGTAAWDTIMCPVMASPTHTVAKTTERAARYTGWVGMTHQLSAHAPGGRGRPGPKLWAEGY
ncbi:hypothetical protein GCM10027176_67910 [Actinoallomurus bryophytorum]